MSLFPEEISDHVHAGFDLSPIGVLAVLLIFVLAQIFPGAAARCARNWKERSDRMDALIVKLD